MTRRDSLWIGAALAFCCVTAASSAEEPTIPAGATPLSGAEIKALLDGRTFAFSGYDQPITGTSTWDSAAGTVSGVYSWQGGPDTPYDAKWTIADGKSCTQSPDQPQVCQSIYRHEDGFIEVNAEGKVHALSQPKP